MTNGGDTMSDDDEKKTFPLEKILNMRTEVWVASQDKQLNDFDYLGVHRTGVYNPDAFGSNDTPESNFAYNVPVGALVVTDFTVVTHYDTDAIEHVYTANGVALIPKKG